MLWYTHIAIGAAAGIYALPVVGATGKEALISIGISAAAALIPDIDAPYSAIGRKQPITSKTVNLVFGHRGVTHSLLGCAVAAALLKAVLPAAIWHFKKFLLAGYISHILADMLTPAGVPVLWPVKKRFRVPLATTGGFVEKIIFAVAAAFILTKIQQLFSLI